MSRACSPGYASYRRRRSTCPPRKMYMLLWPMTSLLQVRMIQPRTRSRDTSSHLAERTDIGRSLSHCERLSPIVSFPSARHTPRPRHARCVVYASQRDMYLTSILFPSFDTPSPCLCHISSFLYFSFHVLIFMLSFPTSHPAVFLSSRPSSLSLYSCPPSLSPSLLAPSHAHKCLSLRLLFRSTPRPRPMCCLRDA